MTCDNWILLFAVIATIFAVLAIVVIAFPNYVPPLTKVFTGSGITVSTILLALATFWLVYATTKIVDSNKEEEKRDRKERYLDEIIRWLKGIENNIFPPPFTFFGKETLEYVNLAFNMGLPKESSQLFSSLLEKQNQLVILDREIRDGGYLQQLASKIFVELGPMIKIIVELLENRRQLFSATTVVPEPIMTDEELELRLKAIKDPNISLDELQLNDIIKDTIRLERNAISIRDSVNSAIIESTQSKANLL